MTLLSDLIKEKSPKVLREKSVTHFQAKRHSHDEIFRSDVDGFSGLFQPGRHVSMVRGDCGGAYGPFGPSGRDINHPGAIPVTGLYGDNWLFQVRRVDAGGPGREMGGPGK